MADHHPVLLGVQLVHLTANKGMDAGIHPCPIPVVAVGVHAELAAQRINSLGFSFAYSSGVYSMMSPGWQCRISHNREMVDVLTSLFLTSLSTIVGEMPIFLKSNFFIPFFSIRAKSFLYEIGVNITSDTVQLIVLKSVHLIKRDLYFKVYNKIIPRGSGTLTIEYRNRYTNSMR